MAEVPQRDIITCVHCGKQFGSFSALGAAASLSLSFVVVGNEETCPHCKRQTPSYTNVLGVSDLEFPEDGFNHEYRKLCAPEPLSGVARAFVRNTDRVVSVASFPWWLITTTQNYTELVDAAQTSLEAQRNPAHAHGVQHWHVRDEVKRAMTDPVAERQLRKRPQPLGHSAVLSPTLNSLIRWRGHEGAVLAVTSVMASMVIGAWTAFEALAGDLWEACLNARPKLGMTALGADPSLDATGESEEQRKQRMKKKHSFLLKKIQDANFDLSDSMGSILRDDWPFIKRQGIIEAYEAVFDTKEQALNAVLRELKGGSLKSLSAMRNVLVHKGGVADKEFEDQVSHDLDLKQFAEGAAVKINGPLVVRLVNASTVNGTSLIAFAADWLQRNPA